MLLVTNFVINLFLSSATTYDNVPPSSRMLCVCGVTKGKAPIAALILGVLVTGLLSNGGGNPIARDDSAGLPHSRGLCRPAHGLLHLPSSARR